AHGMRLVAEVVTDDDRKTVGCQIIHRDSVGRTLYLRNAMHPVDYVDPIVRPIRFRVVVVAADEVPESIGFGRVAGLGAMVVDHEMEADRTAVVQDHRQNVAGMFAFASGAKAYIVIGRDRIGFPHLVRVRQADGVEPVLLDFVQDELVVLCPEAAGSEGGGFGTVPVDAAEYEYAAGRIHDLRCIRVPSSCAERSNYQQKHEDWEETQTAGDHKRRGLRHFLTLLF